MFEGGHSKSFSIFPIRVVYMPIEQGEVPATILISVSKRRFKRAVKRNRVKRQIREVYRKNKQPLLDGLQKRDVKATFFLIGKNAKENPELVKRLDEEGHLIGNHTYNHVEITRLSDEETKKELMDTDEVICSITGKHVEYMRPPFGVWQDDLEKELNVMPVLWSIDPLDWTTKNVDEIVNKVVTKAEENDIILLHDCYDSSVDAALRIVDILKKKGFEFVTADEMIMD